MPKGAKPIAPARKTPQPGAFYVGAIRRSYVKEQYPALVRNNRLGATDLRRLRNEVSSFGHRPLISVVLAALDSERLEQTLDSLLSQAYPSWELRACADGPAREILSRYARLDERIKVAYPEGNTSISGSLNGALSVAEGEVVGTLGCGDELAPDALFEVVKLLQEYPEADVIYTDEDKIDEGGNRSEPHFKPDWSPDLLMSKDYMSKLAVYRRNLLKETGGFREEFDGCQDYDLALRVTERTDRIHHIPKVLYHRRAGVDESGLRERARRALSEALVRRGIDGSVEHGLLSGSFRTRLKVKGEPKVSIIIPTRDNVSLLKNCIESIERLTTHRNYEILIVDNNSEDSATLQYLGSTPHRVITFKEEFNYSRINNFGVSHAEGEYVLLLNDDTEVISGEWLEAMLQHAQRPEVGAVGARLLYPDGRVQHAGVLIGVGDAWQAGVATHSHQFYPPDSEGYAGTVMNTTNYSAVTAACVLLRRSLFDEVGGFNEEDLPISFNDVDLCLRIRELGYLVVYTPHAELYHHESVSRGYKRNYAETLYMRERWGEVLDRDPYYNLNFSRGAADFNLRADLLRPQILRPDAEHPRDDSDSGIKNPLTTSSEELKAFIEARQRAARDSNRNALVPAREEESVSYALLESLELYEGYDRQEDEHTSQRPSDHGPEHSRRRLRTGQLVWMFGSPRTGSTWLSRMMAELDNQERWHEPYIGLLFGSFLYARLEGNEKLLNSSTFIMGEPYRKVWIESIKNFVIDGATARYPGLKEDAYLIVKEPNGSLGAPLLLEATPDSRLVFLIRDSRDVIASLVDATRRGSWTQQGRDVDTTEKLNAFVRHLAEEYLKVVTQVQKAYEAHPGKKVLVRYEDLRHDTLGTLRALYIALDIGFDEAQLEAAVAKHSWERVPDSDKGEGKFYRKAQPGSWREDLSPEQVEIIEEITGPLLARFY